ncbi:PspC domain-containing protein [Marivirga harenae]|uniref:PspC domain-containing protein n=1 Tax=Marivirga harenae TaxID=2010992 RepID=UPI0026DF199C|nr:PspC domain-containing protein [Marivirga harenae]WKV12138.1 PspC domain-containing protein [Marivirga harenae]
MKKNISINIGGIIFHIEEDGFDKLKNYLDAINRYFSDFKDSQEIINDIENRIAEIFLAKLKDDKQVIDLEDVNALMVTLGSIEDFQKAEETDEAFEEKTEEHYQSQEPTGTKRLYRDTKRYIFGGVAAGIAHYFNIDVLWIRLLFIIGFLGLIPFQPVSVFILIAYIVMWIFLPANPELQEDEKVKKLYRSQENKVIGGVARGLAAYFGTDVAVIRILFVLSLIPGGAGLIIYLVLWFITPSAKTVTEKMQMEGTPITLSNIEKNIKSSLKVENGEESTLVKILLFPFRLIAIIINGLAKALGPVVNFIVEAARVVLGIILSLFGLGLGVIIIVLLFASQGIWFESSNINFFDIPNEMIANTFSIELVIVSFLFLLIPALFIMVSGISVMARKWLMNRTVAFSLLAVWFLSTIAAAIIIPTTAMNFRNDGEVFETYEYNLEDKVAILNLKEVGFEDYDVTNLKIRGYEGDKIKLEKRYRAQGTSRIDAEKNAKMAYHNVELKNDSILWFDSNIQFLEDAAFRAQSLNMILYVPYGQEFEMHRKMRHILRNTIYINGYNVSQIHNNRWIFEENEGLNCLTCSDTKTRSRAYSSTDSDQFFATPFDFSSDAYVRTYDIVDFSKVSAATGIFVEIKQGNGYDFQVVAEDEEDLEEFRFELKNERLKVYFNKKDWDWDIFSGDSWNWKGNIPEVKCIITMPELKELESSSAATVHILGFKGDKLDLDVSSAARVYAEIDYDLSNLEVSSASKAYLKGSLNSMNLDISSAAKVQAFDLIVKNAEVDASSASKVDIHVTDYLDANASSAAKVIYQGRPRLESNSSSGAKVSAD